MMDCLGAIRRSSMFLVFWYAACGGTIANAGGPACSRESLKGTVDNYLAALAAQILRARL